jgi:alpha-2-macroglobulin
MKRCRPISLLTVGLVALVLPAHAQESVKTFHVVSSVLNAELERAEICLELSHPINVDARDSIAANLQLEKDGVKIPVSPRDLSLTPANVCVQQLDHRHEYRLVIRNLRDRSGERLDEPVNLIVKVPDRKPSLSFASLAQTLKLPRYGRETDKEAFRVQSLNVTTAQLTLYRVTDRKTYAEAMRQTAQLGLAPTESLYFASHNAQVVWQSELVFKESPNVEQSLEAPLPSGKELPPGLYFLAVEPRVKTVTRTAVMAGQWFLVSNIALSAISAPDGLHVFADDAEMTRPVSGIALHLMAQDGRSLAETVSGQDGAALLIAQDKQAKPAYVTGVTASGDVDIVDLTRQAEKKFAPALRESTLTLDRLHYMSGSTATITLLARDEQGRPQKGIASTLKLLRPDNSLATEQPVPSDKEIVTIALPLPESPKAAEGHLLWQQADGTVLGEKPLRISPDGTWPKIEATTGRAAIEPDGTIVVSIKATDDRNKPLAWRGGRIEGRWSRPEFPAWAKYRFGVEVPDEKKEIVTAGFMTRADGTAETRLKMPLPQDAPLTQAVMLTIRMDGSDEPEKLTVPSESPKGWIGIQSLSEQQSAEKGVASFGILALDSNLKRRAAGEVFYHLYEEGRSFDWVQAEGRWEYRPLPQHRRVGGGRLTIGGQDDAFLRLPVMAGHYVLEITDSSGGILAQRAFQAGRKEETSQNIIDKTDLAIETVSTKLEPRRENKIKFHLAKPAMVSIIIGDDRIVQTSHRFMKAGDQTIGVNPADDWKARGQIMARAIFADGHEAVATLPLSIHHATQDLPIAFTAPSRIVTGATLTLPVVTPKSQEPTFVTAQLTPTDKEGESAEPAIVQQPLTADREGRATLHLPLPVFEGLSRLVIRAWNGNQYGEKMITIPSMPAVSIYDSPPKLLNAGDRASFSLTLENNSGAEGSYSFDITAPPGSRLEGQTKGKLILKRGQSHVVPLEIAAERELRDALRLDIKGPANFQATKTWPLIVRPDNPEFSALAINRLEPGKSVQLSGKNKGENSLIVVGPGPLPGLPRHWQALLRAEPFTTEELAEWLEAARLAREDMMAAGFIANDAFHYLYNERKRQLEKRQNDDGGFSMWSSNGTSDLESTAAALGTLLDEASPATQTAVKWIGRRLDNTWFEESERPARATAFLALAKAGATDLSALRYFADTSKDKELPPVAIAKMANAMALSHDEAAARFWLERARAVLPRAIEDQKPETWAMVRLLADNNLLDIKDLTGDFERTAGSLQPETDEQTASLVRATAAFVRRTGSWDIVVGGQSKKQQGLLLLRPNEKESISLQNASSAKCTIIETREGTDSPPKNPGKNITVERYLFTLEGTPVDQHATLAQGQTYILIVHGTGKLDEATRMMPWLVINPSTSGLRFMSAGKSEADVLAKTWPWLPSPLTEIEGSSIAKTSANFAVQPSGDWRVIVLLKPERSGTFSLPPVTMRDLSGKRLNATQNNVRWQVR